MIKIDFKRENFQTFIDKIADLNKIKDSIRFKITNEYIFMYSTLGDNIMLAFKNHLLKTSDFFDLKKPLDSEIDFILSNCSKLVKNLEFIRNSDKITLSFKEEQSEDPGVLTTRGIIIKGSDLKITWVTSELYEIRNIPKDFLDSGLDLSNRNWSIEIPIEKFEKIIKLSNINSDKIINFDVIDSKVTVYETSAWSMNLGDIDKQNANFIFNKRFFKCINEYSSVVTFHLFDSFILIKGKSSNLMLSYEQDFNEDDI